MLGPRAFFCAGTVMLILAAACTVAAAQAPKGRVSITGEVGGCLPILDDVNRAIRLGNEAIDHYGWSSIDEIGVGYTFTADLRARCYGPLSLSVGVGQSFAETGIDFDQVITIKPRTDFYHVLAFYDIPYKPTPKTFLRVGAGPVFSSGAQLEVRHERRGVESGTEWIETATFKAKGTGAHALIETEMMLNQKTTLVLNFGYRMLNLDRTASTTDFRDWKRTGVQNPLADSDNDGVPNVYDLADTQDGQGYLTAGYLEVPLGLDGKPIIIDAEGRPLVSVRGMEKIDFSGLQASVGLRFYIF
jgi:hypothetical protein